MADISDSDLTDKLLAGVSGAGTFDIVVDSIKLYIKEQLTAGRITGAEAEEILNKVTPTALKQSVLFLLGKQKADKQVELLVESIALTTAQTLSFASNTKADVLKLMHEGYAINLSIAKVGNVPESDQDNAIDDLTQELLIDVDSDVIIEGENIPAKIVGCPTPDINLAVATATTTVYIFDGFSNTVLHSFASSGVRGIAYNSTTGDFITSRIAPDIINVQEGATSTIRYSFAAPYTRNEAVTYDPDNERLISADSQSDKIYSHVGVTVDHDGGTALVSPYVWDIAYIGDVVAVLNDINGEIKFYNSTSFAIVSTINTETLDVNGVTWDGTNMITSDPDYIYVHDGITDTITDTYASHALYFAVGGGICITELPG